MKIDLGNILEPIAPFCSSKDDKAWNGMLKVYLKNPAIDDKQLLCGLRVFALELEGETKIAKVAKGYDSSALHGEFSVKIKGETLANKDANMLLVNIVKDSFSRGFKFEIILLNKNTSEDHAYLIVASPKQRDKIHRHQVSVDNKILTSSTTARQLSAKEIAHKNCLVIIAKNLNLAQPTSDVARCIQELIG
jgi:hypothetical protein